MMFKQTAWAILCAGIFPLSSAAQNCYSNPKNINDFVHCEIVQLKSGDEPNLTVQVEAPSASANSTALADSSASPYLLDGSVTPGQFASRSNSPNANDYSGILNLYGLYVAARHTDPFGLAVYEDTSRLRRFSVGVDHSSSIDHLKTDLAGNTNTYTFKATAFGFRDFASRENYRRVGKLLNTGIDQDFANLVSEINSLLFIRSAEAVTDPRLITRSTQMLVNSRRTYRERAIQIEKRLMTWSVNIWFLKPRWTLP